jgi:hypothetical protein
MFSLWILFLCGEKPPATRRSSPQLLTAVVTDEESPTVFILVTFARAIAIVVVVIPLAIQLVTTWIVPVVAGVFAALVVAVTRTGLEW